MSQIIIIGGGAAGMLCGAIAANNGNKVTIIEKNEKLGKKLFITGKGRCNVTNACKTDQLFSNIMTNSKFMYSCIKNFDNTDIMNLIEEWGCPLKTERGERVFPVSDKSSDVIKAFENALKKNNVKIMLRTNAVDIVIENGRFTGIVCEQNGKKATIKGDSLIIATGGVSYRTTGSTGDGYVFAKKIGHTIIEPSPSLVPFNIKGDDCKNMMGLSLKHVNVSLATPDKILYEEFGEMLFTHFGMSGPCILTLSARMDRKYIKNGQKLYVYIDLKPALTHEQLDNRILREFDMNPNKHLSNILESLMPKALVPVVMKQACVGDKAANVINKANRMKIGETIKKLKFDFISLRDFNEAIITKGGVNVKEINPKTMASKKVDNVYFIGEVLDVDAVTGGFNLQVAWSSAAACANAITE